MAVSPIRNFLDSGVLIVAHKGELDAKVKALAMLKDANRIFLTSPFVWHEVCPKAQFNKRAAEYRFYREYFQHAAMFTDVRLILNRASRESARTGVGAMDSLHIAAAYLLGADDSSRQKSQASRSTGRLW